MTGASVIRHNNNKTTDYNLVSAFRLVSHEERKWGMVTEFSLWEIGYVHIIITKLKEENLLFYSIRTPLMQFCLTLLYEAGYWSAIWAKAPKTMLKEERETQRILWWLFEFKKVLL